MAKRADKATLQILYKEAVEENNQLKAKIRELEKQNAANGLETIFKDVKVSLKRKSGFRANGWECLQLSRGELNEWCGDFLVGNVVFDSDAKIDNLKVGDKIAGVLFSGGYDSVALSIYLLEKGYNILPILLKFNGNIERVLQLSCINQLRKVYGGRVLYPYGFTTVFYGDGDSHLGQQTLCHFWLRFLPENIKQKLNIICVGYNKDDFGACVKDKLTDLYNAGMKARWQTVSDISMIQKSEELDYFPKIAYPLIENTHCCNVGIVNNFAEIHNGLILPCVACGNSEYKLYRKGKDLRMTITPCGDKGCEKCDEMTAYNGSMPDMVRVLDFVA